MMLQILHVPDCRGAEALDSLLGPLVAARPDIQVTRQVVTTEDEAALVAMTGSPTSWPMGRTCFLLRASSRPLHAVFTAANMGSPARHLPLTSFGRHLRQPHPDSQGHCSSAQL